MFGFLETLPVIEGRRARRSERRTKPRPLVTLYGGTGRNTIYRVVVRKRQDGREYAHFTEDVAPLRGKLLAAAGEELPQEIKRYLFTPQWYPDRLLAETALSLLADFPGERTERTLGIIDRDGRLVAQMERFVPLVNRIELMSERVDRYEQIAAQLYREYGAILTCGRDNIRAMTTDFIIACGSDPRLSAVRRPFLTGADCAAAFAVRLKRVRLYGASAVPDGVDSLLFSAALAECNGVADGGGAKVSAFDFRGKTISRAAALELLTIPPFF